MSSRAWAAFAAVSVLWGIPYLFIKVAVDAGVPPGFVAFARVALAAVVLLALARRARVLAGLRGRTRWLVLYALVEVVIPFPLIAAGEQRISSSLAAILIAMVPLLVALLALRFYAAERVSGRRLFGLLVGFSGVVALVGVDVAGSSSELVGAGAVALAACGYAAGSMILKARLADLDPRATMGVSLAIAAAALLPLALADPPRSAALTGDAVMAIVGLGLLCTAIAFVLMATLVAEVGPGRALVITYVNPVVATGLGVAILGERPGAGAIAGLLLILAGSWLSTDGRLPPGLAALATRSRRARLSRPRSLRRA